MTNSIKRTSKCKLIIEEMTWQEILAEYRKLENNSDAIVSLSTNEGTLIACAMFSENRHNIIQSLPKNLSKREFKEQLYFKTYGEPTARRFFQKRTDRK